MHTIGTSSGSRFWGFRLHGVEMDFNNIRPGLPPALSMSTGYRLSASYTPTPLKGYFGTSWVFGLMVKIWVWVSA